MQFLHHLLSELGGNEDSIPPQRAVTFNAEALSLLPIWFREFGMLLGQPRFKCFNRFLRIGSARVAAAISLADTGKLSSC